MGTDLNMTHCEKSAPVDVSQVKLSEHFVILSIKEQISKMASFLKKLMSNT